MRLRLPRLALVLLAACPAGKAAQTVQPSPPKLGDADSSLGSTIGGGNSGLATCDTPARADLMVVDWTPEMRGDIEAAMKEGIAVVNYNCRSIQLVPGCSVAGAYNYIGTTRREKKLEMNSRDEVAANLPVGGLSWISDLGGKLGRESTLAADLIMVGKQSSAKKRATKAELEGSCDGATHFIRATTVGAFIVATGSKAEVGASAKLFGKGASADSASSTKIAAQDGDVAACEKSTSSATTATEGCGAVLRVELEPFAADASAPAVPELAVASCGPGFALSDGACRAPTAPHQCKPGDAADCEAQCTAGDAASCGTLAVMYRDGIAVKTDWTKAVELATRACDADITTGCRVLAAAKLGGQGTKKDKTGAVDLLDKACSAGDGMGCVDLGIAKLADKKLASDAQYAFRRACYGGLDVEGCAWLGTLHAEGKGGQSKNAKMAAKFFEKGCKEDSARACTGLAALTDDKAEAKRLYAKACTLGDAKACKKQ